MDYLPISGINYQELCKTITMSIVDAEIQTNISPHVRLQSKNTYGSTRSGIGYSRITSILVMEIDSNFRPIITYNNGEFFSDQMRMVDVRFHGLIIEALTHLDFVANFALNPCCQKMKRCIWCMNLAQDMWGNLCQYCGQNIGIKEDLIETDRFGHISRMYES